MRRLGFLIGLLFAAGSACAEIQLNGVLTQGALIRGSVEPGSQVWLNEHALRVSPQGGFVFGVGRDADLTQSLRVVTPSGREKIRTLQLEKRKYNVQRITGVAKKHVDPNPEELKRIRADSQLTRQARQKDLERLDFLQDFVWPATGRISGVFGSQRVFNGEPRAPHSGVDVAAPTGASVVAPADGVVTMAHPDMFFSGGTLIVDHGYGVSSTFIHLSEILVKVGQDVKQGDLIARVGATGRATGPHLHWSMNWFDVRLDPALVVPPMETVLGSDQKTKDIKR